MVRVVQDSVEGSQQKGSQGLGFMRICLYTVAPISAILFRLPTAQAVGKGFTQNLLSFTFSSRLPVTLGLKGRRVLHSEFGSHSCVC